jgi:hypothetical protein
VRRVVIHAGFHKTGTTSTQSVFRRNAGKLAPRVRVMLQADMRLAVFATRHAHRRPAAPIRALFRAALTHALRRGPKGDARPVLVSWEGLSGVIPGRDGVRGYAATAPALAADAVRAVRAAFGPEAEITLVYTTREGEAWRDSAWRHLVARGQFAGDAAAHAAMLDGPPDLGAEVARISAAVAPVPVVALPLEATGAARLGAAEALLTLAGLTPEEIAALRPAGRRNVGPSGDEVAAILKARGA